MAKFLISETIHSEKVRTVRLGNNSAGNYFSYKDLGKPVKLVGESRYALCASGDTIEGVVVSTNYDEQGTVDGFSTGGVACTGYKEVTFEDACAIGDFVKAGTPTAIGTALSAAMRVKKDADGATKAFKARVVSLGKAGTGAVGTTGIVEMF